MSEYFKKNQRPLANTNSPPNILEQVVVNKGGIHLCCLQFLVPLTEHCVHVFLAAALGQSAFLLLKLPQN